MFNFYNVIHFFGNKIIEFFIDYNTYNVVIEVIKYFEVYINM